ncbi:uncharacterized protein LOC131174071 [Hevea brasiliensis]|uniref:uncharacterized protein LOC131174071 n=1 Tax=Hevea brasiliensis TaxID=3981 RepID=UPI0025E87DD2|nr:uncharacterized protein LOC131174071 [Hevea brasiliensis]
MAASESYPQSLWTGLMKGLYFPFSDFMEAKEKYFSTWAWRSLLIGREALRPGICWKVSGPSFVNVWTEPWVPTLPDFRNRSSRPPDSPIIYVANLINLKKAQVQAAHARLPSSSTSLPQPLWKMIWSLPVPPKIQNFLWRACSDSLATRVDLYKPKCANSSVWFQSLFERVRAQDKKEIQLASFLAWHIWKSRNEAIFEDVGPNPMVSLHNQSMGERHLPADGAFKINANASFDHVSSLAGLEVVLRDSGCNLVDGCSSSFASLSALAAEAQALKTAVSFAVSRGLSSRCFETDSLQSSNR